jgi:hypothetical protein
MRRRPRPPRRDTNGRDPAVGAAIFTSFPVFSLPPVSRAGWLDGHSCVGSLVWLAVALWSRDDAPLAQNLAITAINGLASIAGWPVSRRWDENPFPRELETRYRARAK